MVDDLDKALSYYDQGYSVVLGELDDPDTYRKLRIEQAAMMVTLESDMVNSNIVNTVRKINEEVTIVSSADSVDSIDLLQMAGSNHVLQIGNLMGHSLSRRTIGQDSRIHVLGGFDRLVIAEAMAYHTPLVGKTLEESKLRENLGINVVGVWERGKFIKPHAQLTIKEESVLIMAGTPEQLRKYDEFLAIYRVSEDPIIIIGGGRVGHEVAQSFDERGLKYCIIDKDPDRIKQDNRYIYGNSEDFGTLKRAGINEAPLHTDNHP